MLGNRGFPEAWSHLCVCQAYFLMTFAMGGVPHSGPRQPGIEMLLTFLNLLFILYCGVLELRCFVSFRCIANWVSFIYIFFAAKDVEAVYSQQKTRPGADCGSDHELLIAKFRLKLKKVGKSTRILRYDLNQFPYDYTVEMRNRFKGVDLIECLMNYGMRFVTLYRRQGSWPSPWKRNAKKQNGCLGRPYK